MKHYASLIFVIILASCFQRNSHSNISDDNKVEIYQQIEDYSEILQKSAPSLTFINKKWRQELIHCNDKEQFLLIRKITNTRFIAVSSFEKNKSYFFNFYDFEINGIINHKSIIEDADFSLDNRNNFLSDYKSIHYFINSEKKRYFLIL
ncbi:MAG: hypothetical protein ABF242_07415 [Flavobacteriales bacterium]